LRAMIRQASAAGELNGNARYTKKVLSIPWNNFPCPWRVPAHGKLLIF
jgi:hypothetical protein